MIRLSDAAMELLRRGSLPLALPSGEMISATPLAALLRPAFPALPPLPRQGPQSPGAAVVVALRFVAGRAVALTSVLPEWTLKMHDANTQIDQHLQPGGELEFINARN